MSLSSRTVVPIVFAAVLGGVIALATARGRSGGTTATAEAPPPAATPVETEPKAERQSTTSSLRPAASAPDTASAAPPASAAPAASTSAATAPSVSAEAAPTVAQTVAIIAPTSPEELHQAELDCDRKKLPEACERVSLALDSGSAGAKDPTRAEKLRRIALTLYVKQCEGNRALSCTRLAEMYERGEIVQKNPKNAAALRARVLDLCRLKPNQIGCQSEQ